MPGPYSTYFDNPFAALRMARPEFKAQAQYALRAVREAGLGAAFTPLLAKLETAIADFDEKLTSRQEPTEGDTAAYRQARKEWLGFVDDTLKDYVTPKLRKLPAYADFKPFGKSRLAGLSQPELLVQSQQLLALYGQHQAALSYPTLAAEAAAKLQAVADLDASRDTQEATASATILGLEADRAGIAKAQRRLKAQLELTFDDPAKVYSFFDFSKAKVNKSGKTKVVISPA
jgi:hypothetical protein